MSKPFDLNNIFHLLNQKMTLDIEIIRSSLEHSGQKGSSVEGIFLDFWRMYLPKNVGITEGSVISSTGMMSKQLDIIFYDYNSTPIFFSSGNTKIIPVECTAAACEVKSTISSKTEMIKIYENMISYKSLDRNAYREQNGTVRNYVNLFGKEYDYWQSIYFVCAMDGANVEQLKKWLDEIHEQHQSPANKRIDAIFVASKGVVVNEPDGKYDLLPKDKVSTVALIGKDMLLFFYILVCHYILQMQIARINMNKYIDKLQVQPASLTKDQIDMIAAAQDQIGMILAKVKQEQT